MDFDQLLTFMTVVKQNSFSKAAQDLFVSQPTVTSRINNLEQEMNCVLFLRNGRSFTLTSEGKRFLQYTKSILGQINSAKEEIIQQMKPKLKIGFPPSFSSHIYINALKKLNLEELFVSIIRGVDSNQLINLVLDGELHLAFIYQNFSHKDFRVEKLANNHLVLLVNPSHHLAQYKTLETRLMNNETMICYIRDTLVWHSIEDKLPDIKLKRIESNNIETVKDLVRCGLGFTVLPSLTVNPDDQDLCTRVIKGFDVSFNNLYVIYKKDSENIDEIETIIQSVRDQTNVD
jgi:DNA-binding transcriptional LysR family regulator